MEVLDMVALKEIPKNDIKPCVKCHSLEIRIEIQKNGKLRRRCLLCQKVHTKNRYERLSKKTLAAIASKWRKENPDSWKALTKRGHLKLRNEAIEAYSPTKSCEICGELTIEFLAIDHIDGGGSVHRQKSGRGTGFYRWLRKNKYPSGFRVLCHNCNFKFGSKRKPPRPFRPLETYSPRIRIHMKWLLDNPDKHVKLNSKKKENRLERKKEVISHYGNECKCCGIKDMTVLTLDHTNNDGNEHRKLLSQRWAGSEFYNWVRNNNFPGGLQVLCFNCNKAKGSYGVCPHKTNDCIV